MSPNPKPNRTDNDLLQRQDRREKRRNDNFNRLITNEFTDLIDVPGEQIGNRNLYDFDYALILVDSDTTGTCEIDINTTQNS